MKKNLVVHCAASAMICFLLAGWACNKSSNTGPKASTDSLVVLQPTAGQTFKVGDTMKIKWQVNDTNDISSIVIQLYRDSLHHDSLITTIGSNSFPADSSPYSWVIPSSAVAAHCYIRIFNYLPYGSYPDSSGVFTITN
jgi:hypothetical protein